MFLAIATVALVAAPRVSHAQFGLVKPLQFGIAGGATQPMSTLKDGANMGYNGTVALGINVPLIPLGLRVDGAYNQFGEKAGINSKLHVISATGNVVWSLPLVVVSPYLIGGAGLYMTTATSTGATSASQTDKHFGWNAGAGIKLPLAMFKAFVEARYNRVTLDSGTMQFVPLTVGIMF
jgi:outer membrane protein with beta-barrel domain